MRRFTLLFALVCCPIAHGQPRICVETDAPGYAPRDVERTVLTPLEGFLDGVEGVQHMRGLALDGKCFIQLDLTANADPELVRMIVQNRVALAKSALPSACATKTLAIDGAFLLLSLEPGPDMSLAQASKWARQVVWPRLASVAGVANIQMIGAAEPGVRITLDPDKLRTYNLTAGAVAAAVQAARTDAERFSLGGTKVTLKAEGGTLADLGNIPILPEKHIFLRDLAFVKEADDVRHDARIIHVGGKGFWMRSAVFVLVQLAPGKLQPAAKQGVEKAVVALRPKLPDGVRLEEVRPLQEIDTTVLIRWPDRLAERHWLEKAEDAVKAMREVPQVRTLLWIAQPDKREGIFYVLAEAGKQAELQKALRAKLARVEGVSSRVGGLISPLSPWPGQGAQFNVRLCGKDVSRLQKTAELLTTRLAKTPGIVDVDHFPKMRQELKITFDRERLALAGVRPADVFNPLGALDRPIAGWPWPITLSFAGPQLQSIEDIGMLAIHNNGGKAALLLRDVATINKIAAPNGVLHADGRPCISVFGNIEGLTPKDGDTALRRLIQDLAGKDVSVEIETFTGSKTPVAPVQPAPADKNQQKPKPGANEPTPVSTVTPRRMTLTRRIEQPGYILAAESTPIYSKIAGFAIEPRVDIGDSVEKGDLLVKLFIPEVVEDLKVKEVRIKQAEADLKLAKEYVLAAQAAEDAAKARIAQAEAKVDGRLDELAHAKKLLKDGKSDQATVDQSVNRWKESTAAKVASDADCREKSALRSARQAAVEVAEANVQVAKATLQQWKAWMAYAELRAPYVGIITQRNVHRGDFVQPSSSTNKAPEPLFVLERIDSMRVLVQVPELDARAVKKGDKAVFLVQGLPDEERIGAVTRQSFALDAISRTLRVECDLPNADKKLRPGMAARAVITGKIDNAWVLPAAAVMNDILADGDIRYCFQVVKGVARRLNLDTGFLGEEGVEVFRKQAPGSKQWVNFSGQEAIVTNPAGLVDGQAVAPTAAEPKKRK